MSRKAVPPITQQPPSVLTVDEHSGQQRLDVFLTTHFQDEYTRSYWANMISHNYVTVNGVSVKVGYKVKANDKIEISWPLVSKRFASLVKIIHSTDDVLIIDKPAGMLTHSKGKFNPEYTVSDFAADNGADAGESNRTGIVHRLDRQTSGIMVIARNQTALHALQRQFASRSVQKFYIAVVEGEVTEDEVVVDVPLKRNPKNPKTFTAAPDGKQATTTFKLLAAEKGHTVLLAIPKTGRTHQIRAHLQHLGHPIVGDTSYGYKTSEADGRFLLHSFAIALSLPGEEKTHLFFAPLPKDMTGYMHAEQLKNITKHIVQATG